MKKLSVLSLLLFLCFPLFSQVYNIVFDENGDPFGGQVFQEGAFQIFKFDTISEDGTYRIHLDDRTMIFDFNEWEQQNQGLPTNPIDDALEIFEPGPLPEGDLIRALAFTPDGSILAALYQHSDNVYFYNSTTYALLASVDVGREPMDITMSDQSAYVCSHTSDELHIISLSDFSVSNNFKVNKRPCQVEIKSDETMVYVGCNSSPKGLVAAYNPLTGEQIFQTKEPYITLRAVAMSEGRSSYSFTTFSLSPHSDYIIAINSSGQAPSVFNGSTGDLVKKFNFGSMKGSGFSVTGDTLYIYTTQHPDSMSLHRVNMADFSVIDSIVAITSESGIISHNDLAINADGTKVLVGGDWLNGRYCFFDFNSYDYSYITDLNISALDHQYTSNDRRYSISQVFGLARFIDLESGQIINRTPPGHWIGIAGAISPVDEKVAFGDGPFYSFQQLTGEYFYVFNTEDLADIGVDTVLASGITPEADITHCAVFSNNGDKIVATNTLTDNISIIDFASGQLDNLIDMDGATDVTSIPKTNQILASSDESIYIRLINLDNYETILELFTHNVHEVFVTKDGKYAYTFRVVSSSKADVKKIALNGASSEIVGFLQVGYSNCSVHYIDAEITMRTKPALSPDGNYMLFGARDDTLGEVIHIVDTRIMQVVKTLPVNDGCIFGYAFTDDSRRVCAVYDYTIPIIYLDGEDSFIESEVNLGDRSYSADYNPLDSLFYILLRSNSLYQVDPDNGELVGYTATTPDLYLQIGISQNGIPVMRGATNLLFNGLNFALPGYSLDFSYYEANNLYVIPIPGPDKICVFNPVVADVRANSGLANEGNVVLYPNPANGEVLISSEGIIGNVKIYNAAGKLVFSKDCNKSKTSIALDNFEEGVYLVVTKNADGITTNKLIVVH